MLIFSFLSIAAVLSFAEHQTLCGVEYQYKEVIGTGSFATVYRAVNTITHEVVAIKHARIGLGERRLVKNEIQALELLNGHPNVVQLICANEERSNMFIVTEFCENGDLEQYSKRHKSKLSENQIRQYLKDLASGLEALGKVNVAHRDIKPANLLIGNDGKLKIADFGAAIVLQRTTMLGIVQVSDGTSTEYQVGSALYRAPELWLQTPYTAAVDLWSVGITLYQLLEAKTPFKPTSAVPKTQHRLYVEQRVLYYTSHNPTMTNKIYDGIESSDEMKRLMVGLIQPIESRISIAEFVETVGLMQMLPQKEDKPPMLLKEQSVLKRLRSYF